MCKCFQYTGRLVKSQPKPFNQKIASEWETNGALFNRFNMVLGVDPNVGDVDGSGVVLAVDR